MKQLIFLLISILSILSLAGCHDESARRNGVEVIIDGDGKFPEFLVGIWRAEDDSWEFVFDENGSITSAMISLGRVRVEPGKTTKIPMKLGGEGVFEPGLWTVQYLKQQRQLTVEIKIDHFNTELGDNTVKGKTHDFFTGQVSQDGQLWYAKRFSYPEYIANTKNHQNYRLPFDPNDNPKESLLFQKVEE